MNKWVNAEKKLPVNFLTGRASLNVLICVSKKQPRPGDSPRIAIGYYCYTRQQWRVGCCRLEGYEQVTHWMPLPAIPDQEVK